MIGLLKEKCRKVVRVIVRQELNVKIKHILVLLLFMTIPKKCTF